MSRAAILGDSSFEGSNLTYSAITHVGETPRDTKRTDTSGGEAVGAPGLGFTATKGAAMLVGHTEAPVAAGPSNDPCHAPPENNAT